MSGVLSTDVALIKLTGRGSVARVRVYQLTNQVVSGSRLSYSAFAPTSVCAEGLGFRRV